MTNIISLSFDLPSGRTTCDIDMSRCQYSIPSSMILDLGRKRLKNLEFISSKLVPGSNIEDQILIMKLSIKSSSAKHVKHISGIAANKAISYIEINFE